jgi:hypothetical protein
LGYPHLGPSLPDFPKSPSPIGEETITLDDRNVQLISQVVLREHPYMFDYIVLSLPIAKPWLRGGKQEADAALGGTPRIRRNSRLTAPGKC